MANHPKYSNHVPEVVLVMFLILISQTSSSCARLFNGFTDAETTQPTLNLALPSDRVVVVPEKEKEKEEPSIGHASSSPCAHHHHMGIAGNLPFPGMRLAGGKYGALILNMFPKGSVPPSGPSRSTNSFNN